jgi:hypothetical protein
MGVLLGCEWGLNNEYNGRQRLLTRLSVALPTADECLQLRPVTVQRFNSFQVHAYGFPQGTGRFGLVVVAFSCGG